MRHGLLLLVLIGTFSGARAGCRNADWGRSFDNEGLSKCDGSRYIKGFVRSDRANPDDIYRLEAAVCCDPTSPYGSSYQIVYADWWGSFDRNNNWNRCPSGFFLQGLYRTSGNRLHNIEEGRCMKPVTHPYHYGHCYEETGFRSSFDRGGTSQCRDNYFITALYRGHCNELFCIENIKCCKMAPSPDVLDSLATVKTMVMDKTLWYLANLAHYLGYGWCASCRAPWVGEDFRRNGDTWEADKSGRCEGYMNQQRLSINYGHWKFGFKNIQYGQPLITSLQPETIDGGVVTNDSPSPATRTIERSEESVRTVTHTTTSSWKHSHELGIEITYTPPGATGGVGGSVSYKFGYESSSTTQDSTQNTQKKVLRVSDSKTVAPYSSTNVSLIISKTRTTMPYTATIIAQFSCELRGFLRWGGGPSNPGTNYHYQHRGSGGRPTVNYRFGDGSTPFYEALRYQSDTMQRPWEWADMKANHGYAQTLIDHLTSEGLYEFTLTGKFDDVIGKRMDVTWQQIPYQGSGGRKKRSAALQEDDDGKIDMGTHQSIARERAGDPAPVYPQPPEVKLDEIKGKEDMESVAVSFDV